MDLSKIRKAIKNGDVEKASFILSKGIHTLELVSADNHTARTGTKGIVIVVKGGNVTFRHYEYSEARAEQIGLAFEGFEVGTQAQFLVGHKESSSGGIFNVIAAVV